MKKAKKRVIILTGPSGAGKSSVAALLSAKGWIHHDIDRVARGLYEPGSAPNRALLKEFGPGIAAGGGRIDRQALGRLVFASPEARKRLDALLLPRLARQIKALVKKRGRHCVDMAVYFSAGAPQLGGLLLLIDAPLGARMARLRARYGSRARAKAQAKALRFGPRERGLADAVITNSGTRAGLRRAVDSVLKALL